MTISAQTAAKRQDDTCSRFDAGCAEIHREYKAAFSQLTILADKLRSDTTKDIVLVQQALDASEGKLLSRMDYLDESLLAQKNELMHVIDITAKNLKNTTSNLDRKMQIDGQAKMGELERLKEDLAQEHLRREQDESAIVAMLESFMQQVR